MKDHTSLPWLPATRPQRLSDLRDTSLAKLVRDDMLAHILNGALSPGQRINEPDVATRLGVSRVPVREALRELESSGLVVARKNSGVFVRQLEAPEISDLYQLRGLLDGFAGRQAALLPKARKSVLLALLADCIAAMKAAASQHQVQAYYSENLRFHWALVEACGNQALVESYRGIVQKLHLSRLKNLSHDIGMRVSIAEHVKIAQAVRKGDALLCEALMARHVSDAHSRLSSGPAASQEQKDIP
jgi:DNA-binding GntR family transcriptional regulator